MQIRRDTHPAPILGLYKGAYTQAFYRLIVPLETAYGPERVAVTEWEAATEAQLLRSEVVILSRVLGGIGDGPAAGGAFVRQMQGGGRRVLIDQDDDIHATPGHGRKWPPARLALFESMLRAADGVICTGETLAGRLRPYGTPVSIVPNYIRPDLWPETPAPAEGGPVWLLLAGSRSHREDWREVAPALARLRARHASLRVRVVCHELFDYLTGLVDDFVPWVSVDRYPQAIAGHHVALCPLPDTRFNRCKSPVKALEAALAGCAVLGSETQYGPLLRAAGLGHAIATPATWERLIERYITDPLLRSRDAATLRGYVTDRLDARKHAGAIQAAYAAHQEHAYV